MDTFDPSTADNPFEKRVPELPEQATDSERDIARRFLRISFVLVPTDDDECEPDATHCWLVVGNQSFVVGNTYQENRDNAGWFCWMIAKAILKMAEELAGEEP